MKETILVLISAPIYLIVIGFEIFISHINEKSVYSGKGTLTNIYLMVINMILDVLVRGGCLYVLSQFYENRLFELASPLAYWLVLLVAQDFLFYVLHVVDHYCRLFWAVHVTHHSSEEFNFTVGFRSSVFQPLYRFFYYIPLAVAGFKPMDIMLMYSATQVYGILVHTQTVNKLGFLEYFLVTPSHHRVHHASNPLYLDRNMGMVFIIWDRLFGTFQEEKEKARYGLTENIKSYHPATILFHEWKSMATDIRRCNNLKTKLKYIFYRPGWSHDGSKMTSYQLRNKEILNDEQKSYPANFSKVS